MTTESSASSGRMMSGKVATVESAPDDSSGTEKQTISPVARWLRVRENAYARAQKRGFVGGSPFKDWLDAEEEVDAQCVTDYRSVFSLTDTSEITKQIESVFAGYGLSPLSVDTLLKNHRKSMAKLAAFDTALMDGSLELASEQTALVQDALNEAAKTLQSVARGSALSTDGVVKQVELSVKAVGNTLSLVKSLTEAITGISPDSESDSEQDRPSEP